MENSFLYLRGVLGSMAKCIFFTQFVDFLFRSILQSLRTSLGCCRLRLLFCIFIFFLQGNRYTFQGDLKDDLSMHGCVRDQRNRSMDFFLHITWRDCLRKNQGIAQITTPSKFCDLQMNILHMDCCDLDHVFFTAAIVLIPLTFICSPLLSLGGGGLQN